MTKVKAFAQIAIAVFVLASQTVAYSRALPSTFTGNWIAFSRTAKAITGSITLSSSKIVFENGQQLRLSFLGKSHGLSLDQGDPMTLVTRIVEPSDVVLLGKNTLCGGHYVPTYLAFNERMATPYELMMMGENKRSKIDELYLTVVHGDQKPGPKIDRMRVCSSYFFTREAESSTHSMDRL